MKKNRLERVENALSQANRMRIARDFLASLKHLPSGTAKKVMLAIDAIDDAQADVMRRINKNINN